MKSLFRYAIRIATLHALLLGAAACSEGSDNNEPDPDPADLLTLKADKTSIQADGQDKVTFTVEAEGAAEGQPVHLVYTYGGKETALDEGVLTFSTEEAGRYLFRAWAGEVRSDELAITATPQAIPEQDWYKRCLGMQFTGVGCPSCPLLSYAIEGYEKQHPDELVTVSFHLFINRFDEMEIPICKTFDTAFNPSNGGTPSYSIDMRDPDPAIVNPISIAEITEVVAKRRNDYATNSGVAIATEYDAATRVASLKARITSNTAEKYRYQIFFTENGIDVAQDGAGADYRHNNVVRAVLFQSVYGTPLNFGRVLDKGVEVSVSHRLTLDEKWNAANMRVVVASLRSEDDGNTWVCDNVASVKLGETTDYKTNK